jgi:hypothetical protein
MISTLISTLGWIGLAGSLLYFIFADRSGSGDLAYVDRTRTALIISAVMVVGGHVLRYVGKLAGVGSGHCQKCGKRIAKAEMFCFDHRLQSIREAQDRTRFAGTKKTKS